MTKKRFTAETDNYGDENLSQEQLESKRWTFKVEDVFEDIPDDPNEVLLKIPEEVAEQVGLEPGDPIKVLWGDQGTIIIEKISTEELERKKVDKSNPA